MSEAAPRSKTVEFFFDYASPWSYLASCLLARELPGVTIERRPIYLRGFPQFANGFPHPQSMLRYHMADFQRCTAFWEVPAQFPAVFPINGLQSLRGALWVQAHAAAQFAAYHEAMFRAAWREGRDVARREVVLEVAGAAGIDPAALAAGMDQPDIKERLRTDTSAAMARGAFGVPTFFVGNDMFFGHDRLDYVRRAAGAGGGAA